MGRIDNPLKQDSDDVKTQINVTGNVLPTEISQNSSNFIHTTVVLSLESTSSPGVSYSVPSCLAGVGADGTISKIIKIRRADGIPSGQYNLTVRIGNKIYQTPVSIG